LVYRKGVDLLVAIIPRICQENPKARFLIAGDGPKRLDLEQMREKFMLQDRVEILGGIPHHKVRDVSYGVVLISHKLPR
jgi:phosphatidylinositol glycan class A protein